jgi:hypothetical protein
MADSTINDGTLDSGVPTDIEQRIAEIDAVLTSGASSVTVDGTTTMYDHRALRAERQRLETQIQSGGKRRRPYVMRPRLG